MKHSKNWKKSAAPTIEEMLNRAEEIARESYRDHPRQAITLSFIGFTGTGDELPISGGDKATHEITFAQIRQTFKQHRVVACLMITEGWATALADDQIAPSKASDRKEILAIAATDGFIRNVRIFSLKRDWKGAVRSLRRQTDHTSGDWKITPIDRLLEPRLEHRSSMRFGRLAVLIEYLHHLDVLDSVSPDDDGNHHSQQLHRLLHDHSALAAAYRRIGIDDITLTEAEEIGAHYLGVLREMTITEQAGKEGAACDKREAELAEAYARMGASKLSAEMLFKISCAMYASKIGIEPLVTDSDIALVDSIAPFNRALLSKLSADTLPLSGDSKTDAGS